MEFWKIIAKEIKNGHNVVLLYVIESNGSSPGRQGFKMAVSQSGLLSGSIGGGIMEHKLVELCRSDLLNTPFSPFIKKQIHQSGVPENKSGMICSGEQIVAFFYLSRQNLTLVQNIVISYESKSNQLISFSNKGIKLKYSESKTKFQLDLKDFGHWKLKEQINLNPQLYIIGGGHVSLALSKFGKEVGFSVTVYDDRSHLNTMEQNSYASIRFIKEYASIAKSITTDEQENYVVIMSFGFKTDKLILKSLLKGNYKYLGMMGSQAKIDTLFAELKEEGTTNKELTKVLAPIGLNIASKTPQEIAISILGQIIQVKNSV